MSHIFGGCIHHICQNISLFLQIICFIKKRWRVFSVVSLLFFFKIKANDKTVHTLDAPNNKGTKIKANQTTTNKLIIEENTTTNLEQFSGVLKESRILLRLKLERRHFRWFLFVFEVKASTFWNITNTWPPLYKWNF